MHVQQNMKKLKLSATKYYTALQTVWWWDVESDSNNVLTLLQGKDHTLSDHCELLCRQTHQLNHNASLNIW